jgi:hypothetical protein
LSHRLWIWNCTHCTGAYTLGACKLRTHRLGAYRLDPPVEDLEMYSLHCGLHTGAYGLEAFRLGVYRLEPPILDLELPSLHWGLHTGGLQAGGLQAWGPQA